MMTVFHLNWLVILFSLCTNICAPPPAKRQRMEQCFVQHLPVQGIDSPCEGEDSLKTFSDLTGKDGSFGAENLAEELLYRSGIFEDGLNLKNVHICPGSSEKLDPRMATRAAAHEAQRSVNHSVQHAHNARFRRPYTPLESCKIPAEGRITGGL